MTEFVVRIDGERGELFVDGKRAQLFGALVGLEVRRDELNMAPLAESSPFIIRARERPVVEVTLRFPLGGGDRLTVLRGPRVEDVEGPTADGESAESATVVPGAYFDQLVADLDAPDEPNERVRDAARRLPEIARRDEGAGA